MDENTLTISSRTIAAARHAVRRNRVPLDTSKARHFHREGKSGIKPCRRDAFSGVPHKVESNPTAEIAAPGRLGANSNHKVIRIVFGATQGDWAKVVPRPLGPLTGIGPDQVRPALTRQLSSSLSSKPQAV